MIYNTGDKVKFIGWSNDTDEDHSDDPCDDLIGKIGYVVNDNGIDFSLVTLHFDDSELFGFGEGGIVLLYREEFEKVD